MTSAGSVSCRVENQTHVLYRAPRVQQCSAREESGEYHLEEETQVFP